MVPKGLEKRLEELEISESVLKTCRDSVTDSSERPPANTGGEKF